MQISHVHLLYLGIVSAPKHRTSASKRVFRLWLRTAMQPTPKGKVKQPIACI